MNSMHIDVVRVFFGDTYTIGKMYLNGEYFCDTLEDKVRILRSEKDKVYGQTAIPYGTYKVTMDMSPRFKRVLPRLHNVPFFEGVLIHRGNTAEDTAGCILVGKNTSKGRISESTNTETRLTDILKRCDTINITIKEK